jgi:hypothetical protein
MFQTEERKSDVMPEQLADHWMICLETARQTLKRKLKLDDLGTDGNKPDRRQWADLLDVDPDFREDFSTSIKATRSKMLMKSVT